tara:strand:+ start:36 stop:326 length:291 start_codon:yes stop_codon:yes gene_type:complete
VENMKLPLALVVAVFIQLAGGVWYVSNAVRDIQDNTDRVDALLEILVETEEDLEEVDEELWSEFDAVPRLMTDLIKLQARVAILEKTIELSQRDGM